MKSKLYGHEYCYYSQFICSFATLLSYLKTCFLLKRICWHLHGKHFTYFGVQDRDKSRINICEGRRRSLCLYKRTTQQTPPSHNVLFQHRPENQPDVADVYFVHMSLNWLLQGLPSQPLVDRTRNKKELD